MVASTLPSVFLSYARADDESFVQRVYSHLTSAGFDVWWDRMSMPSRSLTFQQEIRDAIEAYDRTIVFLGPRAVQSEYVRAEWQFALTANRVVSPVLLDAGTLVPPELRSLHRVNATGGRIESQVLAEILRIASDPPPPLGRLFRVPAAPPHFQPRVDDFTQLANRFAIDDVNRINLSMSERMVVLQGMTGLGKSVMAASLARATSTRQLFRDGVIWVSFGVEQRSPIGQLGDAAIGLGEDVRAYDTIERAAGALQARLEKAAVLLVLDNVWWDEQVYPFRTALGRRCQMLITTREAARASRLGASLHALDFLTREESRALLADWVRADRAELPSTATAVADECGRLPFALSLVGAMAAAGTSWDDLLDALKTADLDFVRTTLPDYEFGDLLRAQQVSVEFMRRSSDPSVARAADRYLEIGAFRWTRPVPEAALVTRWSGSGTVTEREARQALTHLASMALVRADGVSPNRVVSLHDLQQDYLTACTPDMKAANAAIIDAYARRSPGGPLSTTDDGYYFDSLFQHLERAARQEEMHSLLRVESAAGANAWWEIRVGRGQALGFEDDVRRALRDATALAAADPDDAAPFLIARIARYALMIGSSRQALVVVPTSLVARLLAEKRWTPEQALAAARWHTSGTSRVDGIVAVLPWLQGAERTDVFDEAIAIVDTFPETGDRARFYLKIAQPVDGELRARALQRVIELAREDAPRNRVYHLEGAWLLDRERVDWLEEAVQTLEVDATTPEHAIESMASVVPASYLPRLTRLARRIESDWRRASTLLSIAAASPVEDRPALAAEAYEVAQHGRERGRITLLARAARWLPDESRKRAVRSARDALRHLEGKRVELEPLAALLPVVSGSTRAILEARLRDGIATLDSASVVTSLLEEFETVDGLGTTSPELVQSLIEPLAAAARRDTNAYARAAALTHLTRIADVPPVEPGGGGGPLVAEPIEDRSDRVECLTLLAACLESDAQVACIDRLLALPDIWSTPSTDTLMRLARLATPDQLRKASAHLHEDNVRVSPAAAFARSFAHHGVWDEALEMLSRTSGPYELALALEGFPDRVPPDVARGIIEGALSTQDAELASAAIPLMVEHLPADERDTAARVAFSALEFLTTPRSRVDLVRRILPALPCELVTDVRRQLKGKPGDFDDSLGEVGQRLAIRLVECGALREAFDTVSEIDWADARARALAGIVELRGVLQSKFTEWAELVAANAAPDTSAEVLVRLAQCSSGDERERLIAKATEVATHIPIDEPDRLVDPRERKASALVHVAPHVPEASRTDILLEAWRLAPRGTAWSGNALLKSMAPLLARLPRDRLLGPWLSDLVAASTHRSGVLRDLGALAPVIARLGGQAAVQETVTAVEDVARWWPDA